jgi:hypothetical protein
MSERKERTELEKMALLRELYDHLYENTEVWSSSRFSMEISYLFGAILKDTYIEVSPWSELLYVLRGENDGTPLPPTHPVWEYLQGTDDEGNEVPLERVRSFPRCFKPYTHKELLKLTRGNPTNIVEGIISLKLDEIIGKDTEAFVDLISEKLVSSDMLSDVSYRVFSLDGDEIYLLVKGDVTFIIDRGDEEPA